MKINNCNQCNVCEIIHSIALEETALAHILNAEGEKIQQAIACNCCAEELLCVNNSVAATIREVTMLEIVLFNKLNAVVGIPCSPCPPQPCHNGSLCVQVQACQTKEPIIGAQVIITRDGCEVACGNTNAQGLYCARELVGGKYSICVHYSDMPDQQDCVIVECDECTTVLFCYNSCTPTPPIKQLITIGGCVVVSNGQPCPNARICVRGNDTQYCVADCDGHYQIKNVAACSAISVFAQAGHCVSQTTTINNPTNSCYTINLRITI